MGGEDDEGVSKKIYLFVCKCINRTKIILSTTSRGGRIICGVRIVNGDVERIGNRILRRKFDDF